jgi:CcmD family protein
MPENWIYIAAAYAVVWSALIGYRLFLAARRREARELVRKEVQL